jgi:undecaprenyl-diphosphatase
MNILDALLLGALQGLTEFLPISSSGHLILAENLLHLDVEALKSFDIAVHFGTLIAILIYFRKDFVRLFKGAVFVLFRFKIGKTHEAEEPEASGKMVKFILAATIPAILIGAFFADFLDEYFRNPLSVGIFMIAVGVYFFLAEYIAARRPTSSFSWFNTMLIGISQACALIPGISRSGATISTGLVAGIKREEAARFSFLLGSVAIAGAFVLSLYGAYKGKVVLPDKDVLLMGIASSFVFGYASIAFLMRFLKNHTLHVFGVYRVVLGFAILALLLL